MEITPDNKAAFAAYSSLTVVAKVQTEKEQGMDVQKGSAGTSFKEFYDTLKEVV